jgi:predicted type IV restriction endonuclease
MFTICTNGDCNQKYKIKPEMLGVMARCKKCNNIFNIEEHVQRSKILDLEPPEEETPKEESSELDKQRRSPKEVMEEYIDRIKKEVNEIIPRLNLSYEKKDNESDTRLLINKMLQNILGYKIEDIKTEQKIEGRRADYVLSVKNKDVIVIEAKKIGMSLRDRQIFQATSYGAYSGIKWALLTNALVWQLYHISTGDKIETDLIFTIDLMDGLDDEEAQCFYLISKHGMSRKNILDNLWRKISTLCNDNIVSAILTDEVIAKIRTTLKKQTGYSVTDDELRAAIEENILQL